MDDDSKSPSELGWTPIIELARLNPPPRGTFVSVEGRELAVFAVPRTPGIVVIDNACPHANGNLSGGALVGGVVECPWHQWRFDLVTGRCVHAETVCVRKYDVRVREGALYARLCDAEP